MPSFICRYYHPICIDWVKLKISKTVKIESFENLLKFKVAKTAKIKSLIFSILKSTKLENGEFIILYQIFHCDLNIMFSAI